MIKFAKTGIIVMTAVFCLALFAFGAAFTQAYRERQGFEMREAQYRERLDSLKQEVAEKERYLRLAANDPDFLESIVRERLGYARPNETVFRFDD